MIKNHFFSRRVSEGAHDILNAIDSLKQQFLAYK